MKLKSLLFGSAAVLAAGTGAQAADLPTAEPVEYVRICDAFGTGFYYIPGTDTCLRVGGYVRAESHYVDGFESQDILFHYGVSESDFNNYTTRSRGNMRLDARTQTDIGLVRAFVSFNMTIGAADVGSSYANTAALDAAYIQVSNDWGTYTAGYTGSFFDFFGSKGYGTRLLIDDPTGNVTTFGWTFAGGNGFSFTVAAQDSLSGGTGRRLQPTFTPEAYEGQEFPDGVANLRVDQGWGSAQIMGAVHAIHDLDGFENDAGNPSDTELGFAVGAGLSLGIPGGWTFSGQGTYADGALSFVTNDPGIGAKGTIPGLPFNITVGGGVGDFLGPDADDTNEAWGIRAAVWGPLLSPNLEVWLGGSFTDIDAHSIAGIAGSGNLLDYQIAAIQAGAAYTLAPNLTVGPEFAWNQIDWETLPIDNDVWGVMWRIERGF